MGRNEALFLARITWYVGALVFIIGFIAGRDAVVIAAGLAIAGGIVAIALNSGERP